jgi:hypothetical protein
LEEYLRSWESPWKSRQVGADKLGECDRVILLQRAIPVDYVPGNIAISRLTLLGTGRTGNGCHRTFPRLKVRKRMARDAITSDVIDAQDRPVDNGMTPPQHIALLRTCQRHQFRSHSCQLMPSPSSPKRA